MSPLEAPRRCAPVLLSRDHEVLCVRRFSVQLGERHRGIEALMVGICLSFLTPTVEPPVERLQSPTDRHSSDGAGVAESQ